MSAWHDIHAPWRQRCRHEPMTRREAIVTAKSQMNGQCARAQGLDEAPDPPLVIAVRRLARLPVADAPCALDLPGDEMAAKIGREQAQAGQLRRVPLRTAQRKVTPERDAAKPDGAPARAGRKNEFLPQLPDRRAIAHLLQIESSQDQVDIEAPAAQDRKSTRLNSSHLVISYA